jgi:hypothetical protein
VFVTTAYVTLTTFCVTIKTEDEAAKFINYLWQSGSKFKKSNNFGKTAMKYAKINGLTKIVQALQYIQ